MLRTSATQLSVSKKKGEITRSLYPQDLLPVLAFLYHLRCFLRERSSRDSGAPRTEKFYSSYALESNPKETSSYPKSFPTLPKG